MFSVCEGIVPLKDYVMAQHMLSNDTSRAAGMQGHPQSLDDMTDGQIEERFYQSVARAFLISAFFCQLPDIMGGWWRLSLIHISEPTRPY